MILLVLLHKGRGGGLSDMFGGGVSSSLGGSSVAERNLDRITIGIGVIWFACVIALGLLLRPTLTTTSRRLELERDTHVAGGGNAIRGSRVGAGPMGEAERGEAARGSGHLLLRPRAPLGGDVRGRGAVPESWDCPKCGLPASLDSDNPPPAPRSSPTRRTSPT